MGAWGNRACWLGAIVAAALVGGLWTSPAASAATYETSVSPDPIAWPQQLTYRLKITTGAQAEQLRVAVKAPTFPMPFGGEFVYLGDLRLEGPGTLSETDRKYVIGTRFCAPALPDFHGHDSSVTPAATIEVPANSSSTIALSGDPYSIEGFTPWIGLHLGAEFQVSRLGANQTGPDTVVRTPSPKNDGKHGVRIAFGASQAKHGRARSTPATPLPTCGKPFTPVEVGSEVVFAGRADAAIAGQMMTIRYVEEGHDRETQTNLANVRVGTDGSFSYRWRPPYTGGYTVGAFYRSQSSKFTDDFSNGQAALRVVPREQPSQEQPSQGTSAPTGRTAFTPALLPSVAGAHCLAGACRKGGAAAARRTRVRGGSIYRVAVRGRYRKRPCGGKVRLTYRVKGTRTLTRTAKIGPNCRYRKAIKLKVSARTKIGATLRISQRFTGTKTVTAGSGNTLRVKLRRR